MVRDSKLSFFLIASSTRFAKVRSFLVIRLVTFPEKIGTCSTCSLELKCLKHPFS
ncbi:hypothetical protein Hanom_Chr10g00875591 [Helianthus anomalus]